MLTENRKNWIDWAKTLGIFLVVWGHIPMNPTIKAFIYSFHMPLFFLISGYLYVTAPSLKQEFLKNIRTLVIPYIIYQMIFYPYWLIRELISHSIEMNFHDLILTPMFQSILSNPINGPTWFVLSLFFMKLFSNIILQKKRYINYIFISSVGAILFCTYLNSRNIYGTYTIHNFFALLPFFLTGYLIKQRNVIKDILNKPIQCVILLFIAMSITIALNQISYKSLYTSIKDITIFYLVGYSGSLIILAGSFYLNSIKTQIVYNISIGTLFILGIHWMLIGTVNFIAEKIFHISNITYSGILAFLLSILILIFLYPGILVVKKYFIILLGKNFKK